MELDLAQKYGARLDAYLATLPSDHARRLCCDREINKWTERLQEFLHKVESGKPIAEPAPHAADYHLTLCEIFTRAVKYGGALQERS